jgi:hypothetical protein
VLLGVAISQGAGQRAEDNLWHRGGEWARHTDARQGRRWNGGDGACEGAGRQEGKWGASDSYFGVGEGDGACGVGVTKMATVVAADLAGVRG